MERKDTLGSLIATGNFQHIDVGITEQNFPDIGDVRGKVELFEITGIMFISTLKERMTEAGLLPANLRELLLYAENEWDGVTYCMAFGTIWTRPDGNRRLPIIGGYSGTRRLELYWDDPGDRVDQRYKFLTVRK